MLFCNSATALILACAAVAATPSIGHAQSAPAVVNSNDSGAGSLRAAVAAAVVGERLTFAPEVTGTIVLTSGEITISKTIQLIGPGANVLTISGGNSSRVFRITAPNVGVSGLRIAHGKAPPTFNGGGIRVQAPGAAITNCVFADNIAGTSPADGGGLGVMSANSAIVHGCTFVNNQGDNGGAISVSHGLGQLLAINCTMVGNRARLGTGSGGAIHSWGTATLISCTIVSNTAPSSGGIHRFFGTLTCQNCIVAHNDSLNFNDTITSEGHNLFGDSLVGFTPAATDRFGPAAVGPLSDNSGPTPTMAPLPDSPAINWGNDFLSGTDQRGLSRRSGCHVDIGAFEVQEPPCANPVLIDPVLTMTANIGGNAIGVVSPDGKGSFSIVGGGNDIWDTADEFTYAYAERAGDFDVRVRVESLSLNARWSKAGIMVRESLAEDSRMLFLRVTPPDVPTTGGFNGANDTKLGYRTGFPASTTDEYPGENDGQHEDPSDQNPPPYPQAWLRLVRWGNVFSARISADGVTWTQIAEQDTGAGNWTGGGGPFKREAAVGLAVSRQGGGPTVTAEFRSFSFTPVPFTLVHCTSRGNPNGVLVTFSETPDAGHLDPNSYSISGALAITGVTRGPQPNSYWLDTASPLIEGTEYSVDIFGVTKGGLEPMTDRATFTHGAGYEARRIHIGHNKTRLNGENFLNTTAYQRGLFASADGHTAIESNTLFEDVIPDSGLNERYATRIFGLLNINTPGAYRFACNSDDIGNLYLSPDESPSNKLRIAREPEWNGSRGYADPANSDGRVGRGVPPVNQSELLNLGPGVYYLEYTYAEGGGLNNGSVTWQPPGGPIIANGALPIPDSTFVPSRYCQGLNRGWLFNSLGPVQILRQPVSISVLGGRPARFSVVAGPNGTPPYRYQWRRNGQDIRDANDSTFTIPVTLPTDEGAVFSVVVANEFSSVASSNATLVFVGAFLEIVRTGTDCVVLSWPTNFTGYQLETKTSLAAGSWGPVSPLPVVTTSRNAVTNHISGDSRYYRLRKP
jgi:hypothetical protein